MCQLSHVENKLGLSAQDAADSPVASMRIEIEIIGPRILARSYAHMKALDHARARMRAVQ
jgi:hypothetical protein